MADWGCITIPDYPQASLSVLVVQKYCYLSAEQPQKVFFYTFGL